jgi:hypothetical protein
MSQANSNHVRLDFAFQVEIFNANQQLFSNQIIVEILENEKILERLIKGSQDVRYIGADFWSSKRTPAKGPAYTFEWAFSTEDWIFYEGSNPEDS